MSLPPVDTAEHGLLVTYTVADDEPASEALLAAFASIGVGPSEQDTHVGDWVAGDALDQFHTDSCHVTSVDPPLGAPGRHYG